ncbi:RAB-33 protein [Loa loa]|uniref:RAB-33 protein n=1 Tax=Loa loa TaxID=7209 RepID=A0A1I7VSE9_LOALO|nr:RAB-33 protein [Loa loa]EFO20709.2 RAB-33 protein [Loa loa]
MNMSVPSEIATNVQETSTQRLLEPSIIMSAPKISTVVTTLTPQTSLPNLHLPTKNSTEESGQSQIDVGLSRVPYLEAASTDNSTHVEKSADKTQAISSKYTTGAIYAYQPGKTYRTKRVFKVIILGDAGVGKTCLSFRFCNGRFPAQTEATIGVDFRERSVAIDGELIRVQLWDTAGQERYRQSIVSHYYRNVNAVVFVYDVSNPSSFHSLNDWINECRKHSVSSTNDTPHILIGNKCDLVVENRIKTDVAQMFADQNDMALFETSALADTEADHVESIFMTLVHKLQQSKPMHVQSNEERARKEQKLLLKASDASAESGTEGWCC